MRCQPAIDGFRDCALPTWDPLGVRAPPLSRMRPPLPCPLRAIYMKVPPLSRARTSSLDNPQRSPISEYPRWKSNEIRTRPKSNIRELGTFLS